MTHVEFIGPPGAGKSTLYRELMADDRYPTISQEDVVRRAFCVKIGSRRTNAYQLLPEAVKSFLEDEILVYRFRYHGLQELARDRPAFLSAISDAYDSAAHDTHYLHQLWIDVAMRYYIGTKALRDGEVLALDEGFVQRAVSFAWRESSKDSVRRYVRTMPEPCLLVYVDTPFEICLTRQRARDDLTADKPWAAGDLPTIQKHHQRLCSEMIDRVDCSVPVVEIEGRGDLSETVERIGNALEKELTNIDQYTTTESPWITSGPVSDS